MTNELKRYLKNKKNLEDAFLYNPRHEHDSCGVGFVASTDGKQRREVVQGGIDALKAVWHRGAVDADGKTGDGAGILTQIPYNFFDDEIVKTGHEKRDETLGIGMMYVLEKEDVLKNLEKYKNNDYIAWIGHATFIIKLGDTTIITDPVFSKNAGPLIFGPKRFTEPALKLNEIPNIDLFLLTHNHYDHQDMMTIRRFPFKNTKVMALLKLGKYFERNG